MRPLKEAVLLFFAICAIIFSYLLASSVLLFGLFDGFYSVEVGNTLRPPVWKNFYEAKSTMDKL